ncbi:MAG: hypothetical protein CBD91_05780 [Phycisphaeraceae bacterium TMED231]|nr:MAG: hypothetical protein CBD91_05780 [Phycisphaeraceae bacterium TMED231]
MDAVILTVRSTSVTPRSDARRDDRSRAGIRAEETNGGRPRSDGAAGAPSGTRALRPDPWDTRRPMEPVLRKFTRCEAATR